MAESSDTTGQIAGAATAALGNYAVSVAANKRQFKYQTQAMELQQQYNKDLWDYQNAYNTPQQQMERLKAAGLNPRLLYGSGAASASGNADGITPTEVPVRQASRGPEIPDMFLRRLQVRQADAQWAATQQNTANAKTKNDLMGLQAGLMNLKLMSEGQLSKYYPQLAKAKADLAQWTTLKAGALYANEQSKGRLLDQLGDMRGIQMKSMNLDNEFKQNRNDLAKLGIYQSDSMPFRLLVTTAKRMGIDVQTLLAKYGSYVVDLLK